MRAQQVDEKNEHKRTDTYSNKLHLQRECSPKAHWARFWHKKASQYIKEIAVAEANCTSLRPTA